MGNKPSFQSNYVSVWLILLVISLPQSLYAKKYKGKFIKDKADSFLVAKLGKRIFEENIKWLNGNYYYTDWQGSNASRSLYTNQRIFGTPSEFYLRYTFYMKDYPSFYEEINFAIDSAFNISLDFPSQYDFIPRFIIDGTPSNFIPAALAKAIAEPFFKKKGIAPISSRLLYDKERKVHIWQVDNLIDKWEAPMAGDYTYEYVKINAITSDVIDKGEYMTSFQACR